MKKILLLLSILFSITIKSQVVVKGVSPNSIEGVNYNFIWADPAGGDWTTPDFNLPNTFVQDTLELVVDNTHEGDNPAYAIPHPIANEGCLTNNGEQYIQSSLEGKIAILWRGSCQFGLKAALAENNGAVGVIIINHSGDPVGMAGGDSGTVINIPVVMISTQDGQALLSLMEDGPVEIFMGNKQNSTSNDIGSSRDVANGPRYGSIPVDMANNNYSFDLGLTVTNFGSDDNIPIITQSVTGPSGEIYSDVLNLGVLLSGNSVDTLYQTYSGAEFEVGQYEIDYNLSIENETDQDPTDNLITTSFNVTNQVLSLARTDQVSGNLVVNSFPRNAQTDYTSCIRLQDAYPYENTAIEGVHFSIEKADSSVESEYVQVQIFEWNDPFTSLDGAWANVTFNDLGLVKEQDYICPDNSLNGQMVYVPFTNEDATSNEPLQIVNNQRYLVCLQTLNPDVAFGYDNAISYNSNFAYYDQPITALNIDGTWYSGWNGNDAPSIGLQIAEYSSPCDPNPIEISFLTSSENCNSSVTANVSGGSGNYNYTWSNSQITQEINGLGTGVYEVIVVDENLGCSSSASISVTADEPPLITSLVSEPTSCVNGNGSVALTITSNTSSTNNSYTFNWEDSDGIISSEQDIGNLSGGVYYVTVLDQNGCSANHSVTLSEPSAPTITLYGTNPSGCGSLSDGIVSSQVFGGVAPLTYSWDNGSSSDFITGLNGGTYSLTVTDANGCSGSAQTELIQFTPPFITLNGQDPSGCGELDGFITSLITNGTPPFNYIWSNDYTTQDVTNLGSGTYTMVVTDSNGCTASANYTINALDAPVLELLVTNPTGCNSSDGQVTTSVTGGSGNYFYDWDIDETGDFDDNANLENLNSGNYNLTVLDSNGCSSSGSFSISTVTPPGLILTAVNVSCFGDDNGLVSVSVTGENGPFSYSWSNGESSAVISGLSAGMYELTITDLIGCQAMDSIEILEPEELIFDSVVSLNPSCLVLNDGSIEIFISGGVDSYSYLWGNGNTASSINNLLSGDYTITVSDANGCLLDSTINIMGASGPQTGDILGNTQVLSSSISQYSVSQNLNSIYNWSILNGNVLTGQGTNTINVQWGLNGFGQLNVVETDVSGCVGDTISMVVTINSGTGLFSDEKNTQIKVYPNPTDGDFIIDVSGFIGEFDTELLDIMGRTLLRGNNKNMSLNDYPDGLYFLRVYFDGKVQDIRLIKN